MREMPSDPTTRNRDGVILLDELRIDHGYHENLMADVPSSVSGQFRTMTSDNAA
jgi:hypothetical protein